MGIIQLPNGMILQVLGIHTVFGVKWGHFKWPKMSRFHWGYFTISGVIIVTSFTPGRGPLVQSQCSHSQVRICAILVVPASGKILCFFYDCHDWIGNKRIYYPYDTLIIISHGKTNFHQFSQSSRNTFHLVFLGFLSEDLFCNVIKH